MNFKQFLMIGVLASVNAQAAVIKRDCFKAHVEEAIDLNTQRKAEYFKLTNGASDKVFNRLIFVEHFMKIFVKRYDRKAHAYQKNGMDLLCQELVEVKHAPEFNSPSLQHRSDSFEDVSWEPFKKSIKDSLKKGDVEQTKKSALAALVKLNKHPGRHCMKRHLFESIYRFAHFAPLRMEEAKANNIANPKEFMIDVMKFHLTAFGTFNYLDKIAAPIQQKGISILCSEMPDLIKDLDAPELDVLKQSGSNL